MLSGYEYKLANTIHRERLRQAEQAQLQTALQEKESLSIRKWTANVCNGAKRLRLSWRRKDNIKTRRIMS